MGGAHSGRRFTRLNWEERKNINKEGVVVVVISVLFLD